VDLLKEYRDAEDAIDQLKGKLARFRRKLSDTFCTTDPKGGIVSVLVDRHTLADVSIDSGKVVDVTFTEILSAEPSS
jgi:DNA-binding protein YbaB